MRRGQWMLVTQIALLGACGGDRGRAASEIGGNTESIVNGTPTDDFAEVVMLVAEGPGYQALCTGTVIAPRTVLTAAHCLQDPSEQNIANPQAVWVSAGPGGIQVQDEARTWVQAETWQFHGDYVTGSGKSAHDLGVVYLSAGQHFNVPSAPVLGVPPTVGQAVTLVGFGITREGAEDYGVKRVGFNTIAGISEISLIFIHGGNIASGDSGGPAFVDYAGRRTVASVHSHSNSSWLASDARVDTDLAWIRQAEPAVQVAGQEETAAPSPWVSAYRHYNAETGDHMLVDFQASPPGYQLEGGGSPAFYLKAAAEAGTVAIYRCRIGSDHFLSNGADCEGQVVEGLLGYAAAEGPEENHLIRCYRSGDHLATTDASECSNAGYIVEGDHRAFVYRL